MSGGAAYCIVGRGQRTRTREEGGREEKAKREEVAPLVKQSPIYFTREERKEKGDKRGRVPDGWGHSRCTRFVFYFFFFLLPSLGRDLKSLLSVMVKRSFRPPMMMMSILSLVSKHTSYIFFFFFFFFHSPHQVPPHEFLQKRYDNPRLYRFYSYFTPQESATKTRLSLRRTLPTDRMGASFTMENSSKWEH